MRSSVPAKPRVLYICGWGRSGSSIIDRVLGEAPGFVSVGELRSLWDADPAVQRCGCGEPIAECRLWGPILAAMSAASGFTVGSVKELRDRNARSRHLFGLWRAARQQKNPMASAVQYGDVLTGMYAAVSAATGAAIVVDSSKHPAEALLLASRPDVDLIVLHLVRDPRGVAYSWNGRAGTSDGSGAPAETSPAAPPRRGALSSSCWWTTWNLVAESMLRPVLGARYLSLRYEDVMASPRRELGTVVQRLGIPGNALPFVSADEVVISPSHTVAGNPNRMGNGTVRLTPDREWQRAQGTSARWKATLPALPMLHHFGYGIVGTRVSPLRRPGDFRV